MFVNSFVYCLFTTSIYRTAIRGQKESHGIQKPVCFHGLRACTITWRSESKFSCLISSLIPLAETIADRTAAVALSQCELWHPATAQFAYVVIVWTIILTGLGKSSHIRLYWLLFLCYFLCTSTNQLRLESYRIMPSGDVRISVNVFLGRHSLFRKHTCPSTFFTNRE